MGGSIRLGVGLLAAILGFVAFVGPVAADDFTVTGTTYTNTTTLHQLDLWDSYEVVVPSGKQVSYSVTVTSAGGCVELLFAKGHGVTLNSQYLVSKSQESCVGSYSNSFAPGSGDGTDFSVVILTTQTTDVTYKVDVKISDAFPSWVIGLVVLIVIAAIAGGVGAMIRKRKRVTAPPMAPPPMFPPQGPMQPPAQPPMGPYQPPQAPPP